METTKENLIKAVISVMKEVKGMEKNSRVGTGNSAYNGTKDQDVKEVFNEALAKYGLCMLPTGIKPNVKIERWQETDNYGTKTKQLVFTEVETEYTLLHESGEFIILKGYGHGVDSQDKSAGKATTYALKNCLLYSFMTPVGKIDDTDTTHSEEINAPKKTITLEKQAELDFVLNQLGLLNTMDELNAYFKQLNPKDEAIKALFTKRKVALNG